MACYTDATAKPTKCVPVDPSSSPPYCWIGFLKIQDANNKTHYGTGFKINFPIADCTVIITSAQCIYLNGTYATQITVTFPGQKAIIAKSSNLYAPPEYVSRGSEDFNYGLILLPGKSEGFGWSTELNDNDLTNRIVTICGYPGDSPDDTMWLTGGKIMSNTGRHILHNSELVGGQSGSPIYTIYKCYWTVIGVQTCTSSPNQSGPTSSPDRSGPRLTMKMISSFVRQMNYPIKTLESAESDNVFIRCDGSNVIKHIPEGSGKVNCQFSASYNEKFYIYPPHNASILDHRGH